MFWGHPETMRLQNNNSPASLCIVIKIIENHKDPPAKS